MSSHSTRLLTGLEGSVVGRAYRKQPIYTSNLVRNLRRSLCRKVTSLVWTLKAAGLNFGWVHRFPIHFFKILPGDEVYELVFLSMGPGSDARRLASAGKGAEKTGCARMLTLSQPLPS